MLILSYIPGEAAQLLPEYKIQEYASRAAESLINAHVIARSITSEKFSLSYWGATETGGALAQWICDSAQNYIWFKNFAEFLAIRAKDNQIRWRVRNLQEVPSGMLGFTEYPIAKFVTPTNLVRPSIKIEETSIFNAMRMAGTYCPVKSSKKEI